MCLLLLEGAPTAASVAERPCRGQPGRHGAEGAGWWERHGSCEEAVASGRRAVERRDDPGSVGGGGRSHWVASCSARHPGGWGCSGRRRPQPRSAAAVGEKARRATAQSALGAHGDGYTRRAEPPPPPAPATLHYQSGAPRAGCAPSMCAVGSTRPPAESDSRRTRGGVDGWAPPAIAASPRPIWT